MSAAESESVRVTRRFATSPAQVFEAWVEPALLQRWLSPLASVDGRAGGHFRLEVRKPEGAHVVSGEYLAFVPGKRLAMTWVYEGPMAPAGKMEAFLTVEFQQKGSDTEIKLHHEHLTNPAYLDTIRNGAWTKAFDDLQKLLAGTRK